MCAWNRGDGGQRMQKQSWKMGRLQTSLCDTDKVERGAGADFDNLPWTELASAKWLLNTKIYSQLSQDSF